MLNSPLSFIFTKTDGTHMNNAISIYGKMLSFSRIKIHTDNLDHIKQQLDVLPLLKHNEQSIPVVIDCQIQLNLSELIELFWSYRLQPIGIMTDVLSKQADELRLASFPADGKRIARVQADAPQAIDTPTDGTDTPADSPADSQTNHDTQHTPQPQPTAQMSSVIHAQMLRSGQTLHHIGGDLTIIGGVNDGAEAITDNSLHIYGRGLGRLVAGATGDPKARIFCQKFNPSLVSVAGTYCLRDEIDPKFIDQAVQVSFCEQQGLVFTLLEG